MTRPSDDAPSMGMTMIAAYRAARLGQRPALRTGLQQSRMALRQDRGHRLSATEPPARPAGVADAALPPAEPPRSGTRSIFADLVGMAGCQESVADAADPAPDPRSEAPAVAVAAKPQDVASPVVAAAMPVVADGVASTGPPQAGMPMDEVPADPGVQEAAHADTGDNETGNAKTGHAEPVAPAEKLDPPLAEIGFGPGMLIRFSQLGLRTIGDLAQADATLLRASLGDISRLVDVETWINSARESAARAEAATHPSGARQ